MNTNRGQAPESLDDADARLRDALAALREDRAPAGDLWPGIAARLQVPVPVSTAASRQSAPLAGLRHDLTPGRDLWPQIEGRIRQPRWRRLRTPLAAAAGLAASLVLTLGLQVQHGAHATAAFAVPAPLHASPEVLAAMDAAPPADAALRRASLPALSPESRALVRANLKIVANAETQLRRALAADPDSAYLESLLQTARQQKQDLRVALAERP